MAFGMHDADFQKSGRHSFHEMRAGGAGNDQMHGGDGEDTLIGSYVNGNCKLGTVKIAIPPGFKIQIQFPKSFRLGLALIE